MKFKTDTGSQNKPNNGTVSSLNEWVAPERLQWVGNRTIYVS